MATWAIGDIQGCAVTLERLLARVGFDERRDRLWLVGDLVNRGAHSLEVLRRVKRLGDAAVTVLGNHDLHLIARALGVSGAKKRDTVEDVLAAPDRDELIAWLRARPLLHREGERVLVHAGLLPEWTVGDAESLARELEARLRGGEAGELLASLKRPPDKKSHLEAALHALTRLRACHADGAPCADFDGPPSEAPAGCLPWFDVPGRKSASSTVVFGHWSALGLHLGERALGLDTGCVWGRELTALRLDDRAVVSEPAAIEDRA